MQLSELLKYYEEILNQYKNLKMFVNETENAIISNEDYIIELKREDINKILKRINNIFKAYNEINAKKYGYIDYLVQEFHFSEEYIYYLYLGDEISRVEDMLFDLYEFGEMPEDLIEKIYKKYFVSETEKIDMLTR